MQLLYIQFKNKGHFKIMTFGKQLPIFSEFNRDLKIYS